LIVAAREHIINPYESTHYSSAMSARRERQLIVAHYHLRPGGVRRVIETALPAVAAAGALQKITLATGEPPESAWLERLRRELPGVIVDVEVRPGFLYRSEQNGDGPRAIAELTTACTDLLRRRGGDQAVLWVHNLALGRNAPLAAAWAQAASATGAVLLSHHHDFFFDNRWIRWPEIVGSGFVDLSSAARTVFPSECRVAHLAINRADHTHLAAGFGERARWLPNPTTPPRHAPGADLAARRWLADRLGGEAPYWLLPCRLLRRKNLAEALLLMRWLQPGASLVTTGGVTSPDEEPYRARLAAAAREHAWPLHLAVLAGADHAPPVSALMAGADAITLTSLQEGFGLPYLEAAAVERPLVARALSNVLPDLAALGLRVPTTYEEVLVSRTWFKVDRERAWQEKLWRRWQAVLPAEARAVSAEPVLLSAESDVVPFNRLTLTAQLEVLARPAESLRDGLAALNPPLAVWSGMAADWPPAEFSAAAAQALSPAVFARDFWAAVDVAVSGAPPAADASSVVLREFLAERLRAENLYPLVFDPET
jgi:hypothetical protein